MILNGNCEEIPDVFSPKKEGVVVKARPKAKLSCGGAGAGVGAFQH